MEAASENRGRGRPPKFPPEAYPQGPGAPLTRRGRQDRAYASIARQLIKDRNPEGSEWLIGGTRPKLSLLAELGRVATTHGEEAFWEAVTFLLREKPKVKDGIRVI